MRHLLIALAVGALLVPTLASTEPFNVADPVKVVELKDLKIKANEKGLSKPTVITNEEELAKAITDKDAQSAIKKQVDFKTQQVVFFSWSGSSGEKLTHEAKGDKKVEVVFTYTPSSMSNLVGHTYMFVIPKDAMWKLEGVK